MPTHCATSQEPRARIARVAVEVAGLHLDRPYDYRVPDDCDVAVGQRVQVSFSGRRVRGLVLELTDATEVGEERLKPLARVLGRHAWVRADELDVLRWAATRFGAPLGDVLRHALPPRVLDVERRGEANGWYPSGGERPHGELPVRRDELWEDFGAAGARLLDDVVSGAGSFYLRPLAGADLGARIVDLVGRALEADRDVVVIAPDPASHVLALVAATFEASVADLRGGASDRVRYREWLRARCGMARVVIGERGAAFAPVERLGLAVVLDEANPMHKERRSPRHHAREVVLERARRAGGVGLAVGMVPSAVAWRLLQERRLDPVVPTRDAERRVRPRIVVADWDRQPRTRLSREALSALRKAVDAGAFGVVFATRRGEGRLVVCAGCGHRRSCPTCASSLSLGQRQLRCELCGSTGSSRLACPECGTTQHAPVAAGTSWIARELRRAIDAEIVVLEGYNAPVPEPPAVLVTTRGSILDAPPGRVDAVVLPDLDSSLRRPALDAAEDTLRVGMALASWTVHDEGAGTVVVQTREPEHHAVTALQRWDPGSFWRAESQLRAPLGFPPARHAIRIDVEGDGHTHAQALAASLPEGDELLGPASSDGRSALLIKSLDRGATLAAIEDVRRGWSREGVDARLDVDPVGAL